MFNANEVLNQLAMASNGANRLIIMVGAKNFAKDDEKSYVSFRFMRGAKNKANYIKITLTPEDLYDVEFGRIYANKYTVISKTEGMYCDMLKGYFEDETSLYLSL